MTYSRSSFCNIFYNCDRRPQEKITPFAVRGCFRRM